MSKCHRYIRHIHDILKLYICTAITINIKVCIAGMHGGDIRFTRGLQCAPSSWISMFIVQCCKKTLLAMSDETKENAYRCQGGEDLCRQPVQRSV